MSTQAPYMPHTIFAAQDGSHRSVPSALIAPPRYIQGDGVFDDLGRYLSIVPSKHCAILISARGRQRDGERLLSSLQLSNIDSVVVTFQGECSAEEVARVSDILQEIRPPVDCVVAVGGGKCLDTGKCVAARLAVPVVICPSLASNDAPCSACSVLYTPEGVVAGGEFFPQSPALVVVDTRVVAKAPVRHLVAGMGDAMATWYEARTCLQNPRARSLLGARPTLAAVALSKLCAETLFADGLAAVDAVRHSDVTDALERIVEANTLLSGIGFESGGLAVAHAVAQGFTVVPALHQHYLHGEMVAMGLLTQLMIENQEAEARQVAAFFARVGLPIHLEQLSLSPHDKGVLDTVMEVAMLFPYVGNEPFTVTAETLLAASLQADALGKDIAKRVGDSAYRQLHA